jgi:hypothetical protein
MTAADETPAQPTCGAHPPYSDGHRWTCGKPPHRDDHEGDGMTWAQTRHEDEIRRRDLANAHRGEVVEGSGVAIEPRDFRARPDAAPAPDTAGTDDDVYRAAAEAYRTAILGAHVHATDEITRERWLRVVVDAARAPLLAEVERLTRELADLIELAGSRSTRAELEAANRQVTRELEAVLIKEVRAKTAVRPEESGRRIPGDASATGR